MDELIIDSARLSKGSTDINGDGKADICARAANGFRCWLSKGDSFETAINGPKWEDSLSWGTLKNATSFRLVTTA